MAIARLPDRPLLHPLHAILLAFPVALFTGCLIADIAYLNTAEIQWSNFAAWMNAGGLLMGGVVIVWAILAALSRRGGPLAGRAIAYLMLLALMWIIGLVNAFQHGRDGWSSVGSLGVMLSVLTALLALIASWIGHAAVYAREARP